MDDEAREGGRARSPRIRVLSLAVVRRGGDLLVVRGFDDVKDSDFFRPPGGGVEFGETAAEALEREMMEELDAKVSIVRLLGVNENLFTHLGRPGHEIVFLFETEFIDRSLYNRNELPLHEEGWAETVATWKPLGMFAGSGPRLVPEALFGVLSGTGSGP